MARLGSYDAILADIRLPDMTGYDVFCQLRAAQPQARVILMTAFGYDPAFHRQMPAGGPAHVLYKPFRVDQLVDALENEMPRGPVQHLRRRSRRGKQKGTARQGDKEKRGHFSLSPSLLVSLSFPS